MTRAFNKDCMEAMRDFPDKFFDLAIVDPPYFEGFSKMGYFGLRPRKKDSPNILLNKKFLYRED